MKVRMSNDEIVEAVSKKLAEKIPEAKVVEVEFTRQKGGRVYADIELTIG